MPFSVRKAFIPILLALPLLAACKDNRTAAERAAADVRQKQHALAVQRQSLRYRLERDSMEIEAKRAIAEQEAVLRADTERRRNREFAAVAKVLGIVAVIAAAIIALGFWARQVLMQHAIEAEITQRARDEWTAKTEVAREALGLLRDPNSGLSLDAREDLLRRVVESSERLQLTHAPE